jgi:hypothetical protein
MAPLSKFRSKAASKGSKADQSSNKSAVKPSGPRVSFTHEGHHDDDEVILPETFPFAEVIPSWGPNFNPNVMNAALGKQFSKGHHVTVRSGKTLRISLSHVALSGSAILRGIGADVQIRSPSTLINARRIERSPIRMGLIRYIDT